MKKAVAMILSGVLAASMMSGTVYADESEAGTEETGKTYKVGISMFVMDAGMTALSGLMKDTLESADIPIEVDVTSADSSAEKQNSDIEDLVTKGCDAIWVQGFDENSIVGALEYAYDNGAIVALSGHANTDKYTYQYQNADDRETGFLQGDWFVENCLKKNPDTDYKIAMCNGVMSTASGKGRRDGFVEKLEDSKLQNYEIVTEQDCEYITENAQAWAEGLMTSHPEVNAIVCGNDDMALGVANAISAVGRTDDIVLLGTDGHDTGITLMEDGKMDCTIRMNVEEIGAQMALSIIDALKGDLQLDENKMTFGDASKIYTTVDETNYQDYVGKG